MTISQRTLIMLFSDNFHQWFIISDVYSSRVGDGDVQFKDALLN